MDAVDGTRRTNGPIRVLYVDDDGGLAGLVETFLERDGFDVVTESSAEAGADRLDRDSFDCVVSDYEMPGQDGLEFLETVREDAPDLPFVLYTGRGSEEIASEAISAGVTDYMQKGTGTDQYTVLANRVRNAVSRARAKRAEQAAERRLGDTLSRVGDGIMSLDREYRVTYANERAADHLDVTADDLVGEVFWDVFPDARHGTFHRMYDRAFETQEPVTFVSESNVRPGRWFDVRAYPAADGLSVYWVDVSERIHHDRLVRELYQTAQELLEHRTPSTVCQTALDAVERILGYRHCSVHLATGTGELYPLLTTLPVRERFDEAALTFTTETPVVGSVFRSGVSRVVLDRAGVTLDDGRALVERGVVLPLGDHGVFVVGSCGVDDPPEPYLEYARVLATNLESALTRAAQESQLRESRNKLGALHDVGTTLQRCRTEDEMAEVAVAAARDVLSLDHCLLARHEDGSLALEAFTEDLPYEDETRISVEDGIAGRVYRTGTPALTDDASRDPDTRAGNPFASMLTLPIGDWGVFQALSMESDAFDGDDLERASILTTHLSEALSRIDSERQLRTERDLLAAFFEESNEPVVRVVFDGDVPLIERTNDAFCETFGLTPETAAGEPLDDLVVPGGDDGTAGELNRRSAAGEPMEAEVCRLTPEGERHFLFRSVPFERSDETPCGYGIYVDISERAQREQLLAARNERLDEFAGVVSHDLRSPLTTARGALELVETDQEALEMARRALDRMEELVDSILAFARAGERPESVSDVSLEAVARSAWDIAGGDGATVRVAGDRQVRCDPARLQQLLENLFRNCVEHGSTGNRADPGDSVERGSTGSRGGADDTADAASDGGEGGRRDGESDPGRSPLTVTVEALPDGFAVNDDGPGIPPGDRECVFDSGFSTRQGGTGYGLRIVRSIAEAHGWWVTATESPSGGARFDVRGMDGGVGVDGAPGPVRSDAGGPDDGE